MIARKTPPGFFSEAACGFLLSAIAALLFAGLTPLAGAPLAARLVLSALGLALMLRLLRDAHTGRLVSFIGWLASGLALFVFDPALQVWLLVHIGLLWLLRALYSQPTLIAAAMDAVLCIVASVAGIGAALHTHSLFLGLWTFFLIQALHRLIPRGPSESTRVPVDEPFEAAWRCADAALRRLSGNPS